MVTIHNPKINTKEELIIYIYIACLQRLEIPSINPLVYGFLKHQAIKHTNISNT